MSWIMRASFELLEKGAVNVRKEEERNPNMSVEGRASCGIFSGYERHYWDN